MGWQICPGEVANMMKLAWLYWQPDWVPEDEDGRQPDEESSGHWEFKEHREDWYSGKWKRIVYCEVEE